jgi:tetratricopeptide (TPR) repeat protein
MRLDPKFAGSYYGRGMVRFAGGELEGAVDDFTKALSLDGRLARAYANRGLARLLQGRVEEAERDLSRAVSLDPQLRAEVEARVGAIKGRR